MHICISDYICMYICLYVYIHAVYEVFRSYIQIISSVAGMCVCIYIYIYS